MKSKKRGKKENFYLPILNELKNTTNLSKIREKLKISKQNLNYYLKELTKKGFIVSKGEGWYELTDKGKNPTKYDIFLEKDTIRGHAYVWEVKLIKKPDNWNKRLDVIKKKGMNYKLVGAKENTPRIKALGRKVWLCNNHLRIFDTENSSYYGITAAESRKNSFFQLLKIVRVLENKLGFLLRPFDWEFKKEHYALIKNDFAIDQNNKGIIIRIKDESGEWLLVDDSLEKGGELETVGKKAFETNIPMQKWWNNQKETNFKVTPDFVLNTINKLAENQQQQAKQISNFAIALNRHIPAYEKMGISSEKLSKEIRKLTNVFKRTLNENKRLKAKNRSLGEFIK